MDDFEFTNYVEFCLYLEANIEEFELILDYDEFQVWLHCDTGCYYYIERVGCEITDFYEVELCAELRYDVFHDLMLEPDEAGMEMSQLFECDCCGEGVCDDYIRYVWFKRTE